MKNKSSFSVLTEQKPALAAPVAEPVNLLTSQQVTEKKAEKSADLVMIGFRVTPKEKKAIQRLASDLDLSMQALLREAFVELKRAKGVR